MGMLSTCVERYPHLGNLLDNPYDPKYHTSRYLLPVREHAVELARDHALDELAKASAAAKRGEELQAARRRKKATQLLYRLLPGKGIGIGAIKDPTGMHLTEPSAMADALRKHWAEVFKCRGINHELLHQWLVEDSAAREAGHGPVHDSLQHFTDTTGSY